MVVVVPTEGGRPGRHYGPCQLTAVQRARRAAFALLIGVVNVGGGGGIVTVPPGWHTVRLESVGAFAVPPDARAQNVQPIDSIFGMLRGDGYEIIYDYGRSREDLEGPRDQPEYTRSSRSINDRDAEEVFFASDGKPWGRVRVLQVRDGVNSLTIRVSCVDDDTCALAEDVFNSVRFTAGKGR